MLNKERFYNPAEMLRIVAVLQAIWSLKPASKIKGAKYPRQDD